MKLGQASLDAVDYPQEDRLPIDLLKDAAGGRGGDDVVRDPLGLEFRAGALPRIQAKGRRDVDMSALSPSDALRFSLACESLDTTG